MGSSGQVGHIMAGSLITKALGSTSIRHRSNTFVSDRCLIDIDPSVFAIWDGRSERTGRRSLSMYTYTVYIYRSLYISPGPFTSWPSWVWLPSSWEISWQRAS